MAETPVTRSTTSTRKTLLGLSVLLIVLGGGVAVWTTTCPCNQTPGFMLLGDVQTTPVTDWSFVNDVPLCQIQVNALGLPQILFCIVTGSAPLAAMMFNDPLSGLGIGISVPSAFWVAASMALLSRSICRRRPLIWAIRSLIEWNLRS